MSKQLIIDQLLEEGKAPSKISFYKTKPGDYAEHDKFLGVPNPALRKIAKQFLDLSFTEIEELLLSPYNEKRLLALFILIDQYQKGNPLFQEKIVGLYKKHLSSINNWNLVDASAHLILGAHLFTRKRDELLLLASSKIVWERRIAIVSTLFFIRQNDLEWTFKLAKILLNDPHDLIHKATGWMLREAGKRNIDLLKAFLSDYASLMPRTMLRYAIEKLRKEERDHYIL
jgi:3-methyladenine DNA glycosylase AlkD